MIHLVVENVRTFVGRHTVPIAPLTLLVGENSTGKSSFLAALSAVTDHVGFPFVPGFNRQPYQLGNYDTIATYKGGKYGRARTFSIGYVNDELKRNRAARALATYRGRNGQPELAQFTIDSPEASVALTFDPSASRGFKGKIHIKTASFEQHDDFSIPRTAVEGRVLSLPDLLIGIYMQGAGENRERRVSVLRELSSVAYHFTPLRSESIAPIRTKPERTYGTTTEDSSPSGDQIPFVLERLLRDSSSKESEAVINALESFGAESGLFGAVKIRNLGSKAGEPFQVMVKIAGRDRNVVDVGYGVSQALPVVVQSALSAEHELLLIQQPEVHLHPRAQAALGSFLVHLVSDAQKRFVIESHSDFIIDRIRQDVAAGKIDADKVRILFFERHRFDTSIHELCLDNDGNVRGAPPSYRSFFLQEELRLLARSER